MAVEVLRGVLAKPGQKAEVVEIRKVDGSCYDDMSAAVDGYIELLRDTVNVGDEIDLWVNEEFLLRDDCAPNRDVYKEYPQHKTTIYGPMLWLKGNLMDGDTYGLSDDEIAMVMAKYGEPEHDPEAPFEKHVPEPCIIPIPDDMTADEVVQMLKYVFG